MFQSLISQYLSSHSLTSGPKSSISFHAHSFVKPKRYPGSSASSQVQGPCLGSASLSQGWSSAPGK